MLKRILVRILFCYCIYTCAGCVHEPLVKPDEKPDIEEIEKQFDLISRSSDSVYFQNDILPIFLSTCAVARGCHMINIANKPVAVAYYDYFKFRVKAGDPGNSSIYNFITSENESYQMPRDKDTKKPYKLEEEKIQQIKNWILQGAQFNGCNRCEDEAPTFDSGVNLIILQHCANTSDCHGTESVNGDFSAYEGMINVLETGDFAQQVLIDKTMPKDHSLNTCEMEMLKNWMENNAKEY